MHKWKVQMLSPLYFCSSRNAAQSIQSCSSRGPIFLLPGVLCSCKHHQINCMQLNHLIFPVLHAERRNCIPTHLTSKTQHSLQHEKPKSTCWTTCVLWMTLQAAKFSKFAIFSKAQPDSVALKYRENCLRLNSDYRFRISRAVKVLATENKPTEKRWGQILQFSVLCYLINLNAKELNYRWGNKHLYNYMTTPGIIQIHHPQNQKTDQQEMSREKKSLCSYRWIFIPFTWHLTKMFHSNRAGVIPQQGMGLVITQSSTILHSTSQKWEEKTGQWANSVLKLSFLNSKKSLKAFFFRSLVCFLMQCCWLSSSPSQKAQTRASPAPLSVAAQRWQSDALAVLGESRTLQLPWASVSVPS